MVFDQTLEGLFVRGLEGRVTPTLRLSLKAMMGRALFSVLQLLGPRRVLDRVQQSFRSGNNYTEVRILERAPAHLELWMNEAGPTRYLVQGAILAGMRGCGVSQAKVRVLSFTAEDVTFEVEWHEAS